MCLNQIFKDEQLAMMRYMRATSAPDVAASMRQLRLSSAAFQPFPYPHRPFVWSAQRGTLFASPAHRLVGSDPRPSGEHESF